MPGIFDSPRNPSQPGVSWYGGGYNPSFTNFATQVKNATGGNGNLLGYELMNEPHCRTDASALDPYKSWGSTISSILKGGSGNVGYGQKANNRGEVCDSPVISTKGNGQTDFQYTNDLSSISITSGHYYNDEEKNLVKQALQQGLGLGKIFYIGEAPATLNIDLELGLPIACFPEEFASSSNCCGAISRSTAQNNSKGGLFGAIGSLISIIYDSVLVNATFTLPKPINPITQLAGASSAKLNSPNESYLAHYFPDGNYDIADVDFDNGGGDHFEPLTLFLTPEDSSISESKFISESDRSTKSEVYYSYDGRSLSGDPIVLADKRIDLGQRTAGLVANSMWSNPDGDHLSREAPVGKTQLEYLGYEENQKYQAYLQDSKNAFLAHNYSNEDIAQLAVDNQKKVQAYNYNSENNSTFASVPANTAPRNYAQLLASPPPFSDAACIQPVKQPIEISCEVIDTMNVGYFKFETPKCDGTVDSSGNASCGGGDRYPLDGQYFRDKFAGDNIREASGFANPINSEDLVDRGLDEPTQPLNAGYSPLSGVKALMYAFPDYASGSDTANASTVEEKPYDLSNPAVNKTLELPITTKITSLIGSSNIETTDIEVIPQAFWNYVCSGFAPKIFTTTPDEDYTGTPSSQNKFIQRILAFCFPKDNALQLAPSYCGSMTAQITNGSGNYTITDTKGNAIDFLRDTTRYFVDPASKLKIKLANRFVDGATLVSNGVISPANPYMGGCNSNPLTDPHQDDMTSTMYELWAIPFDYLDTKSYSNSDLKDYNWWDRNAIKLKPTFPNGGKPVNVELDLNVKPGYYAIRFRGSPCSYDAITPEILGFDSSRITNLGNGLYKFVMEDSFNGLSGNSQMCAKYTVSAYMRGYSSERAPGEGINGDKVDSTSPNANTSADSCILPNGYKGTWNIDCRDRGTWSNAATKYPELYESIFGKPFKNHASECVDIFGSTFKNTPCDLATNQDVGQANVNLVDNGTIDTNLVSLDPPWESQTPTPVVGTATYYNPGIMQTVCRNREAWSQIPKGSCTNSKYKGYIAMLRKGDLGREVYIKTPDGTVTGPYLVVDVGAQKDIPSLLQKNFVVDLSYELAQQFGTIGGPKTGFTILSSP